VSSGLIIFLRRFEKCGGSKQEYALTTPLQLVVWLLHVYAAPLGIYAQQYGNQLTNAAQSHMESHDNRHKNEFPVQRRVLSAINRFGIYSVSSLYKVFVVHCIFTITLHKNDVPRTRIFSAS